MFKGYREQACRFECRLKFAARKAGCVPWEYPLPTSRDFNWTSLPFCLSSTKTNASLEVGNGTSSLAVFESLMNVVESQQEEGGQGCDCMPNCEQIEYDTQVYMMDLDADGMCDHRGGWDRINMVMDDWAGRMSPAVYWSRQMSR